MRRWSLPAHRSRVPAAARECLQAWHCVTASSFTVRKTVGAIAVMFFIALIFANSRSIVRAQSTSPTTWAVSIVLPPRLVAGQPATLAVLGVDGRLAEGITVQVGLDQHAKTDKTGRAFFTAPKNTSVVIATASGNSAAALVDSDVPSGGRQGPVVAPIVSQLDQFPMCGGGYRGDVDADHVTLNGDTAFVLAASPECMVILASPRAIPGPAKISIETPDAQWTATTTLVSLHFDPPLPPLVPENKSKLVLHVQGSDQVLRVSVENKTPGVLRFVRGDRQALLTSGGPQNSAEVEVKAIRTGDYSFHARILAAPDWDAARRYLVAAESIAPQDFQHVTKTLADRLTHHSRDTQKVKREVDEVVATTMAGDYRTLFAAAASALE
jgi:hypothetical protein